MTKIKCHSTDCQHNGQYKNGTEWDKEWGICQKDEVVIIGISVECDSYFQGEGEYHDHETL